MLKTRQTISQKLKHENQVKQIKELIEFGKTQNLDSLEIQVTNEAGLEAGIKALGIPTPEKGTQIGSAEVQLNFLTKDLVIVKVSYPNDRRNGRKES